MNRQANGPASCPPSTNGHLTAWLCDRARTTPAQINHSGRGNLAAPAVVDGEGIRPLVDQQVVTVPDPLGGVPLDGFFTVPYR
jgi:hypothetical protein